MRMRMRYEIMKRWHFIYYRKVKAVNVDLFTRRWAERGVDIFVHKIWVSKPLLKT